MRSRPLRGCGIGCFVLTRVLDGFCPCFGDNGMLWLQLAGGLPNINALSLYTYLQFIVTSLDGDKTPIVLLQVQDTGIRDKVLCVLANSLTLRLGAPPPPPGPNTDPDAACLAGDSNRGLVLPWKPPNKPPQQSASC